MYSAAVDNSSIAAREMPTLAAGSRFCRWKVLLVRGASSQVLPTDMVPQPTSSSRWVGEPDYWLPPTMHSLGHNLVIF